MVRRRILVNSVDAARKMRNRLQPTQNREWYRIRNSADGSTAQIHIYDEIGFWGTTAAEFVGELTAVTAPTIELHINSPGGEVFDGLAIYNALRAHSARKVVYIDSLAASIASVIAMAGDEVIMAQFSQVMIHEGSGLCMGSAADMLEMAQLLDRQSDNIAAVYADRAGGDVASWRNAMREETWYTAQEAVDAGLADRIAEPPRQTEPVPTNRWDLTVFRYAGRDKAPAPANRAPEPEPVQRAEPGRFAPVPTEPEGDDDGFTWNHDLANAFRGAFEPEPVTIPDDVVIDPREMFNAIREGLLSA